MSRLSDKDFESLEQKVFERLKESMSQDKLAASIIQIAVRATRITLQEYEKIAENQES
jgi:hypothetical protein